MTVRLRMTGLILVALVSAGCGSADTGGQAFLAVNVTTDDASAAPTPAPSTVTQTTTVLSTPAPEPTQSSTTPPHSGTGDVSWPQETGQVGTAPTPEFPAALDGWKLTDQWSDSPRTFTGQWTVGSGPSFTEFPATMNGCDSHRFLVRWRAVNDVAAVQAGYANTVDVQPIDSVVANAGWMDFDGCSRPVFRQEAGESSLTNLAVDVQQWLPAPGSGATQSDVPTGAPPVATDLDGEVHAFVAAIDVDQNQITVDKVDWFEGAAAAAACAEDGEEGGFDDWCTGYYFRNINPMTRVVSVSGSAVITSLDGSASIRTDLRSLQQRLLSFPGASSNLITLTVTNGEVERLEEFYQP